LKHSFPKSARVLTRHQYKRISHQSKRYVGYWIIVDARQNKKTSTKLGITASRHYGIAVKRNRFKRIVREAFRLCRSQIQVGLDLNVKPRQTAHKAKSADIQKELLNFLALMQNTLVT
jgi:ribonuclease P protein component